MQGSQSDDTSVVNELAVKNEKGEVEERRAVMDLPRTFSFKQTQTSALRLLLCFHLHPEATNDEIGKNASIETKPLTYGLMDKYPKTLET